MASTSSSSDGPSSGGETSDTASTVCWSTEFSLALGALSSESLSGYPLLVRLTDASLVAAAREHRLGAFDEAGTSLALERAPGSEDAVDFWVALPTQAMGVISIRLVGQPDDGIPVDTSAVWADYLSVWHLDDAIDPDGSTFENRADRLEFLSAEVPLSPEQSIPAILDRGVALDGIDDTLSVTTSYADSLESFSLSLWGRFDGVDPEVDPEDEGSQFFVTGINGDGVFPFCNRQTGGKLACRYRLEPRSAGDEPEQRGFIEGFSEGPGVWFHVAFTRDAASGIATMVVNGVDKTELTNPEGRRLSGSASPLLVGRPTSGVFPEISVDEIRVSDRALPVAWFRADVLSQRDPTLAVVDSELDIAETACPP